MEDIDSKDLELINRIVELKVRLIEVGTLKGFNHVETITCSQELDMLLNNLQKIYWESPNYYTSLLEMIHK
ncbi:aspartyl-phosphate phosphatase Spo0E family protein [Ureibacillus sp. NPDC094379]